MDYPCGNPDQGEKAIEPMTKEDLTSPVWGCYGK
jgi:hypothetical protein